MPVTSAKATTVIVQRHAGSHLILPLVKSLKPGGVFKTKGRQSLFAIPSGKLIVFRRNPRNRLVSMFRWKRKWSDAASADAELAKYIVRPKDGMTPVAFMHLWAERWIDDPTALHITFEDLASAESGPKTTARIAAHVGSERDPDAAFAAIFKGGTYTGTHSDWRVWFGPRTLEAYAAAGGTELDKRMGYGEAE